MCVFDENKLQASSSGLIVLFKFKSFLHKMSLCQKMRYDYLLRLNALGAAGEEEPEVHSCAASSHRKPESKIHQREEQVQD